MNGLSSKYLGQIDFFHYDVDESATRDAMSALNVRNRSTYLLLAPDGTEIARWIGGINPADLIAEIDSQLEAQSN